ncbi:hypothetical protein GWK47_054700 [Chionoecetes opilio]|uniref:C2H2-type domain-containing protein n=1 Tax=Chionoecetes opilio TaxID=41210 RepID=A0A8J4Y5U9_CHIOP|nr:hypothetical protein GWK47_054700 [Chionoecetes opilio]
MLQPPLTPSSRCRGQRPPAVSALPQALEGHQSAQAPGGQAHGAPGALRVPDVPPALPYPQQPPEPLLAIPPPPPTYCPHYHQWHPPASAPVLPPAPTPAPAPPPPGLVGPSQSRTSILYTPAECPLCKRRFFNKYSAKRHMIQAHGENFFHTRPYARTDPSAAMFSAALQAMGGTNPPMAKGAPYAQDGQTQGAALLPLPSPPTNHPHAHPHPHRHNLLDPSPLPAPRLPPGECAPRPLFSPTHNL